MNKKTAVGAIVVIVLLSGYFIFKSKNTTVVSPSVATTSGVSSTADSNSPADTMTIPTVSTQGPSAKSAPSDNLKDCGKDMDCFITQANTCGPAKVEFSDATTDSEDVVTTLGLKINKTLASRVCMYTFQTEAEKIPSDYSADVVDLINSQMGTKQSCSIPSNKLAALLTNWKNGGFDSSDDSPYSSDFVPYNCTLTTPDGASLTTTTDASGNKISTTHGETYPYDDIHIGTTVTERYSRYQFKIIDIESTSAVLISFTNSGTKQTETTTAKLNTPVTINGYVITVVTIDQTKGEVALKVKNLN